MSDDVKIDTVRSYSTGIPGRTLNSARTNHFVIDSSSGPAEAVTSGEAFLSGISSCGVNIVGSAAREAGVQLSRTTVSIDGIRSAANTANFQEIRMCFEVAGATQEQAEQFVETYKSR